MLKFNKNVFYNYILKKNLKKLILYKTKIKIKLIKNK